MQSYSDFTSGATLEREPIFSIQPVETYPAPVAAQYVYEGTPLVDTLHTMYQEADQRAAMGMIDVMPMEQREAEPSTPEAFRTFLETVQGALKESDAVQHLKDAAQRGDEITEHDVEAVFRAYERALSGAIKKLRGELSPEQLHQLQYAATSELDWSLRDMITQHVVANAETDVELRFDPKEFFLILNPKARKIEYMDSKEILGTLRRSMSRASKDQLQRDLNIVRRYEALPQVQEVMHDDSFNHIESSV